MTRYVDWYHDGKPKTLRVLTNEEVFAVLCDYCQEITRRASFRMILDSIWFFQLPNSLSSSYDMANAVTVAASTKPADYSFIDSSLSRCGSMYIPFAPDDDMLCKDGKTAVLLTPSQPASISAVRPALTDIPVDHPGWESFEIWRNLARLHVADTSHLFFQVTFDGGASALRLVAGAGSGPQRNRF